MLKTIKKVARFAVADGGPLKARVFRSAIWVGISQIIVTAIDVGRSIVLARLLTPEIFGLMALASIAIRAIETFTRPGIAQALIARQRDFDEASATAFTMLVGRGLVLAVAMAAAAPWVAAFYQEAELESMLQILSLVFVVGGFANINTIARQRELDFRRLTYLSQATTLAGTLVTLSAAYWLRSVWALVIGQIASVSINMALSYWFVEGRPRFAVNREVARELLGYGKFITGSSIVLYVASELDSVVIGKFLGTEQLGFYTLALTIANLVTTTLSKVASSIMMPAYSKLQSDIPALRNAYLRTLSLVMFAVLPAALGLISIAGPFIQLVYGDRWLETTVPLQILAIFGLFRALAAFSGYLFEGMGIPKVAFTLGMLRLAIIAVLIVPMTHEFGLQGAAVAVTVGIACHWLLGLAYLRRHVGIGLPHLLTVIWRPLWTAILMVVVVRSLMSTVDAWTLGDLAMVVGSGVIVFGLLNVQVLSALRKERWS